MRSHPLLAFATASTTITASLLNPMFAAKTQSLHKSPSAHVRRDQRSIADRLDATRLTKTVEPIELIAQPVVADSLTTLINLEHQYTLRQERNTHALRRTVPRSTTSTKTSVSQQSVWVKLRDCESGGNYSENSGNGYYGAYQFSPWTWWSLGLPGMPNVASSSAQDAAARALQVRSGWRSWPSCSATLGLS